MMNKRTDQPDRRKFMRLLLYGATGACVGTLTAFAAQEPRRPVKDVADLEQYDWGFLVDTTRCIGCSSCVRACGLENNVPDSREVEGKYGYFRTWVERYEIDRNDEYHVDVALHHPFVLKKDQVEKEGNGGYLPIKAFFVPKLCNHCRKSACTQVCPVGASFHSPDGVVLIDKKHCVGCGYCVQACPYGCRYIDHDRGTADKCTLCYHRIHRGQPPACVEACPREARLYGNLKDPNSRIQKILHSQRYHLLKPELGTKPKCHYLGLDMEVI